MRRYTDNMYNCPPQLVLHCCALTVLVVSFRASNHTKNNFQWSNEVVLRGRFLGLENRGTSFSVFRYYS